MVIFQISQDFKVTVMAMLKYLKYDQRRSFRLAGFDNEDCQQGSRSD